MSQTVKCHVSGREEPVIDGRTPFREPLRSEIRARIGAFTWKQWLDQQLKIINEYRLNLADPSARDFLERAARQFLRLEGSEAAEPVETGIGKARELGNLPGDYRG